MNQNFLDFLIKELKLSEEKAQKLVKNMLETSEDWLLLSIIDLLPVSDAPDFEYLLKAHSPSSVVAEFLRSRIPDLDNLLRQRLQIFQQDIMEAIKSLKASKKKVSVAEQVKQIKQEALAAEKNKQELETNLLPIQVIENKIKQAVARGDWATAADLVNQRKKQKQLKEGEVQE